MTINCITIPSIMILSEFKLGWYGQLGCINVAKRSIHLTASNTNSIHFSPHYANRKGRDFRKPEIDKMLASKVIERVQSELSAPTVYVSKEDISLCFGVDYQQLNALIMWDSYLFNAGKIVSIFSREKRSTQS